MYKKLFAKYFVFQKKLLHLTSTKYFVHKITTMKKLLLLALCWPVFQMYSPLYAQKEKTGKDKSREIIIMKNSDKDTKVTIETRDGKVFINGKPASDYKDDNFSVITGKENFNFAYTPRGGMNLFNNWDGEKKSFLGVTTEKTDNGVKITDESKGSAAEKAGLKEGDIITKVGDKKISDPEELAEAVTAYKPKEEIKIYFNRNGKSDNVKATLGERSNMAFSFNNSDHSDMVRNFNFSMPKIAPMHINPGESFGNLWRVGNHRLGVRIEDTENDNGTKVTHVDEGSVADKAGIKNDDVITEVNGKPVKNVSDVLNQVRDVADKNAYTIKAKRNGSDINFDIKIPKRKNNADL